MSLESCERDWSFHVFASVGSKFVPKWIANTIISLSLKR
jgi:hypothetical protein